MPGDSDDFRAGPALVQFHDHLEAVPLRHVKVGDDQAEWFGPQNGARLDAIGRFTDRIAGMREAFAEHLPQLAIVFNDKHLYYRVARTLHTFLALCCSWRQRKVGLLADGA